MIRNGGIIYENTRHHNTEDRKLYIYNMKVRKHFGILKICVRVCLLRETNSLSCFQAYCPDEGIVN